MKYEIKQLNENDAVVILDKEPKINDWYNSDLGINKLGSTTRYVEKYRHKVIATISPFKLEGLPMLELSNQEEDVEKMAELKYPISKGGSMWMPTVDDCNKANKQEGFIEGYKQFSEAGIRNAFKAGREKQSTNPSGEYEFDTVDSYLQSLQDNRLHYFIRNIFRAGYKAAQKQYSEEDMRDIYNYAKIPDVILYLRDGTKKIESTSFENFIQSLQKKQFPIAVELTEDLKPIKWHYEK
jgi:hypothetical protein